jgi:hypothetical protein
MCIDALKYEVSLCGCIGGDKIGVVDVAISKFPYIQDRSRGIKFMCYRKVAQVRSPECDTLIISPNTDGKMGYLR